MTDVKAGVVFAIFMILTSISFFLMGQRAGKHGADRWYASRGTRTDLDIPVSAFMGQMSNAKIIEISTAFVDDNGKQWIWKRTLTHDKAISEEIEIRQVRVVSSPLPPPAMLGSPATVPGQRQVPCDSGLSARQAYVLCGRTEPAVPTAATSRK
jgi:hypothetical protein